MSLHGAPALAQTADALYADRENLASARQALAMLAADVARDAAAYEPAWKLARISYWLGSHAPASERRAFLERGISAAQAAARISPNQPEGHFWAAATMGALAENYGMRVGLRYRKPIRTELETVLRLDPAFMQGSADRALGRFYAKVPSLLGGSREKAERHLRASLRYNPDSTISRYFLAELLIDANRKAEARTELQRVLDAPLSTEWAPEDRDYKTRASALLATLP